MLESVRAIAAAQFPTTLVLDAGGQPIHSRLGESDPYRPDTVLDGGLVLDIEVRASSLRGRAKRYTGGQRQDDMCLRPVGGSLILAVADGAASAPRSHIGASLAVRQVVAALELQLAASQPINWHSAFYHAAWAMLEEHRRDAADPSASVSDAQRALGSTLAVAVISQATDGSWTVEAATIGDSPVFILRSGRANRIGGPSATDGDFVSHVVQPLPLLPDALTGTIFELAPHDVVLVATDGFSDPFHDGRSVAGKAVMQLLQSPPELVEFAYLMDFSQETFDDDRTVVAAWIPEPVAQ